MSDIVRSPLIYQMYTIMKYMRYSFNEVIQMPHMLKELLYHSILYDYGANDSDGQGDGFIDLDDASIDQIEKVLGAYKNERK